MRQTASLDSVRWFLAAVGLCLAASSADAQLFAGKREIERQSRVEWLMMKRHAPLAPNPRVQEYVECVAYSIINVLPEEFQDLDWEVAVFDDDQMNAFANPIGKIGVFTGLLDVADTAEALAAVIGHEVAHVTLDHVMERLRKQRRSDALVMIGNAATGLGSILQGTSTLLIGLPFEREKESEADLKGLEYMAQAGFDPRASLYLWRNMSAARENRSSEWLSTHPSDERRMEDLARSLAPALVQYNAAREAGAQPNCY